MQANLEDRPGQAWLTNLPKILQQASPNGKTEYVLLASTVQYTCLSALFSTIEVSKNVTKAEAGQSVDISQGLFRYKTSKRGSVSLVFSILDTECKVINMHLKQQSLQ